MHTLFQRGEDLSGPKTTPCFGRSLCLLALVVQLASAFGCAVKQNAATTPTADRQARWLELRSKSEGKGFALQRIAASAGDASTEKARADYKLAEQAYRDLDFEVSQTRLDQLEPQLTAHPLNETRLQLLHRTLILRGAVAMATDRNEDGDAAFRDAVCLSPRRLDAVSTPPQVRQHHAEQLAKLETGATAKVQVEASAGPAPVELRIDGKSYGATPLTFAHCGRVHVMEVILPSKQVQLFRLDLTTEQPRHWKLSLDPADAADSSPAKSATRARKAWRSPWLWASLAAVVVAATVTTAVLLTRDKESVLVFEPK